MLQSDPTRSEPLQSTVLDALARAGFVESFIALPDGFVRCTCCEQEHPAATLRVHALRRFEGITDPDDEAIAIAVSADGCRGVLVLGYGPTSSSVDRSVLATLPIIARR